MTDRFYSQRIVWSPETLLIWQHCFTRQCGKCFFLDYPQQIRLQQIAQRLPYTLALVMQSLALNVYLVIVGLFSVVCRANSVSISEMKVLKTGQILLPPDTTMSYTFLSLCSACYQIKSSLAWNLKVQQTSQATEVIGRRRFPYWSKITVHRCKKKRKEKCSIIQWSRLHFCMKVIDRCVLLLHICTQREDERKKHLLVGAMYRKVCPENILRKLWRYVLLVRAYTILYACVVYVVPFHVFKLAREVWNVRHQLNQNKQRPATGFCYRGLWHSLADGQDMYGRACPTLTDGSEVALRLVAPSNLKQWRSMALKFADHPGHDENPQ
jgi:hypothetical protein